MGIGLVIFVQPRILVVSKLVSLTIYFLAATILADLLNFPLGSLLAFGGVSGMDPRAQISYS
jgi:hypothetical protein